MKKYFIITIMLAILCAAGLIYSCKKTQQDGGCTVSSGGINPNINADITFYITKDLGCAVITFSQIRNTRTQSLYYLRHGGTIDRYFTKAPTCGENTTGTVWAEIEQGDTYEYTLACTNRTYTGTVSVACGETCKLVEIK